MKPALQSTRSPKGARKGVRKSVTAGFTLVELLVVVAIIGLLAALLFPVFKTARENGYQANCASNLQQIFRAVQLYRADEKKYPSSLAFLLPTELDLAVYTADPAATPTSTPNTNGAGYFKGGTDSLLCPDDDTNSEAVRSSYGDISVNINLPPPYTSDMSRYVWNYWGYKDDGTAYLGDDPAYQTPFQNDPSKRYLVDPSQTYNATTNPVDVTKLPRMSNRFAPTSTIITHCIWHRMPTSNLSDPIKLYDPAEAAEAKGAKDIVVRLDGTAKVLDVSAFNANGNWQKQRF